ncbi:MAG: bifunctional diaminohydroxyphosphoribosylaminopyrimidine deaminase/5-amino-6-(5-phosphoribosylamino)uracil reductase RibD [Saprospiraceae bacterium]
MAQTDLHEQFMRRCFHLARLGAGSVSPNPLVGALLVFEGRIIGEGWHQRYGEAHAEVNAVRSVAPENQRFIAQSTLYCSLEPCFHFGKTPPCVDLILAQKIPRVVVSCTDPNPQVAGQSLRKLQAAGVDVVSGVLEQGGRDLNRPFFKWITRRQPYVVLKWAQSADGYLGKPGERTAISGMAAQRLVHRWRSESDAIFVGTTTALTDDPRLDNRLFFGKSPLRVVLDLHGKLPPTAHLLDDSVETLVLGKTKPGGHRQRTRFAEISPKSLIPSLLEILTAEKKAILFVEGGANIHAQFLASDCWDEVRVIENERFLHGGIPAPTLPVSAILSDDFRLGPDRVRVFRKS